MAEIVYFKINRFFDATDLADDSMNIYIQWQNADGESGASKEWIRDIESEPGYIIFGWPITSSITKTSGSVKFSVRFYKLDSDQQTLAYSFSTLTSSVTVRPALDFDVTKVEAEDMSKQILNRLVNSQLAGVNVSEPQFLLDLVDVSYLYNVETNGDEPGTRTLRVYCYSPNGTGTISYTWVKIPADGSEAVETEGTNVFEITKDSTRVEYKSYYTKAESGTYVLYNGTLEDAVDNDVDVYEMYSTFVADAAGKYYVVVTNTAKVGETELEDGGTDVKYGTKSVNSTTCVIPVPVSLEVISPAKSAIISDEEDAEPVEIEVSQTSTDNEDFTQFSYQWKKKHYDDEEFDEIEDATDSKYSPTEDGLYFATVTNTLNKATMSADSDVCRVTHAASKPDITEYIGATATNSGTIRVGRTLTLKVDVKINDAHWDETADSIAYQWYDYNIADGASDADLDAVDAGFADGTYDPSAHTEDKIISGAINNFYTASAANTYYCLVTTTYNGTVKKTVSKRFVISQ
jgi:hypothetical protein